MKKKNKLLRRNSLKRFRRKNRASLKFSKVRDLQTKQTELLMRLLRKNIKLNKKQPKKLLKHKKKLSKSKKTKQNLSKPRQKGNRLRS